MRELGPDGTSSDECGLEDGIKEVYYTKVMLWRRELERELRIIDEQWLVDTDLFTPRGLKPGKRIQGSGNLRISCPALASLLQLFYNEQWLDTQPSKLHMQVSMENFKWYNILGQSCLGCRGNMVVASQ